MMILENLKRVDKVPNTYGYISLGNFCLNYDKLLSIYSEFFTGSIYSMIWNFNNKKFEIYAIPIGSGIYFVLGNIDCLPGELLVNPEEILSDIRKELEQYIDNYMNKNLILGMNEPIGTIPYIDFKNINVGSISAYTYNNPSDNTIC